MIAPGGGTAVLIWIALFNLGCIFGAEGHVCDRPCGVNPDPMHCHYKFTLHAYALDCDNCQRNSSSASESSCRTKKCDTSERISLAINRQSPGPAIIVCKGDKVIVDVDNRLPSSFEVSIHWHGQQQSATPFYDGVAKVTQCPVTPGSSFRYHFRAEEAGTHFYYAHSVSKHADGLYGAFVVNDHDDNEPDAKVLLVGTRNAALLSGAYGAIHGALVGKQRPVAKLVLNGQEVPSQISFGAGRTIFKIINAIAYNCPLNLQMEGHVFKIIRMGGSDLVPLMTKKLTIYPGERYDFELHRMGEKQETYKMQMKGGHKCNRLADLELKMQPVDLDEEKTFTFNARADFESLSANCSELDGANFCSAELQAPSSPDFSLVPDQTFHLQFGLHRVPAVSTDDLEFRFVFNEIEYYPTFLDSSDEDGRVVPHINFVSHRPPSTPTLTQPGDRSNDFECKTVQGETPEPAVRPRYTCKAPPAYCECNHFLKVKVNSTVKLVLDHLGMDGMEPGAHTFHLHGHDMYVTSWSSAGSPMENAVENPVARDTVTVPPLGKVAVVFRATNPGFWMLESQAGHITSAGVGMALIVEVGDYSELPQVPKGFPTCSGHKPDDFIF